MSEINLVADPVQRIWLQAVTEAVNNLFTVLGAALKERHKIHRFSWCDKDCHSDCDFDHDGGEGDALNPHLNQFYLLLDVAERALRGESSNEKEDVTVDLLIYAFTRPEVQDRHLQLSAVFTLSRDLMAALRQRDGVVEEESLGDLLTLQRHYGQLVLNALPAFKNPYCSRLAGHEQAYPPLKIKNPIGGKR